MNTHGDRQHEHSLPLWIEIIIPNDVLVRLLGFPQFKIISHNLAALKNKKLMFNSIAKKVIKQELMIMFYGIIGQLLTFIVTRNIDIKELFKSIFPIATSKYWYMSVYMIIIFTSIYKALLVIQILLLCMLRL